MGGVEVTMSTIGQRERVTQKRVVKLFQEQLDYIYYGDWQDHADNSNIEADYLRAWLDKQGVEEAMANNAIRQFNLAATMGMAKNSTTPIKKFTVCCVMA